MWLNLIPNSVKFSKGMPPSHTQCTLASCSQYHEGSIERLWLSSSPGFKEWHLHQQKARHMSVNHVSCAATSESFSRPAQVRDFVMSVFSIPVICSSKAGIAPTEASTLNLWAIISSNVSSHASTVIVFACWGLGPHPWCPLAKLS